jgi:8-oxo-dGTP pyrophosphatase MutT (NUDIX family)
VLERYRYALHKQRAASVNAHLIVRDKNRVLFLLRKNTGYCDGMWGLVSGHVEHGESASEALMREAKEEIGIIPSHIKPVHVMHRKSDRNNVDIFFECIEWNGTINNNEMEKCAACAFYSLDTPPTPFIDYIAAALKSMEQGHFYSEYGWH